MQEGSQDLWSSTCSVRFCVIWPWQTSLTLTFAKLIPLLSTGFPVLMHAMLSLLQISGLETPPVTPTPSPSTNTHTHPPHKFPITVPYMHIWPG